LLGNCGYQLVLGANDQATADYASRALGKRTARYKSESRTIELFGVPRRTKVEQIRERDLMMPQEIRQLPAEKMILIVQGQKPIFGDKLRYYETEPFKSAIAYSYANIPDVPPIEYLPERPVPATTEAYAAPTISTEENFQVADGGGAAHGPRQVLPLRPRVAIEAVIKKGTGRIRPNDQIQTGNPTAPPRSQLGTPTRRPTSRGSEGKIDASSIGERARHAEERLKPTAEKLRKIVAEKLEDTGSAQTQRRKSYLEIFDATVPDPLDIGLAVE
jgi:type IV secretion system protein VirD4